VGGNPERLADAIHDQLSGLEGPVPVQEIALALDIEEIREEHLTSFEGALITSAERDRGAIVVNRRSPPQRRRFTVGHELGHFLNPWHKPTAATGFECTRADMIVTSGVSGHLKQEAEANRFAIALLAPARRLASYLMRPADLEAVLALATDLDISKAAAVRRYVAIHDETLAVVFSRNDLVLYVDRQKEFPSLSIRQGDRLPLVVAEDDAALSWWEEADGRDWLKAGNDHALHAQRLQQAEGHAMTLLRAEAREDDDEQPGFYPRR
jgi:Zn-dependent peptidase ImmA (M78 family)